MWLSISENWLLFLRTDLEAVNHQQHSLKGSGTDAVFWPARALQSTCCGDTHMMSTSPLPSKKKSVRKNVFWASVMMTQQVRTCAKPDILSLILRTYLVAEEK